jgi:electron transport complex protein RnfG
MNDKSSADTLTIAPPGSEPAQQEPAEEHKVSTFRLVATLAIAGILAGILIAMVNQHTKPIIDAYRAEQLRKAVYEVLPDAADYSTFYLVDGALSELLPEGAKESEYKRIYAGHNEAGEPIGVAFSRGESGFQDVILVIMGYDPERGTVSGMKVLESKETPGLGDKIFKDQAWVDQFFAGPKAPLIPVKPGTGKGLPGEIDTITGATISTKAVIQIVNNAIAEWTPVLEQGIPETEAQP